MRWLQFPCLLTAWWEVEGGGGHRIFSAISGMVERGGWMVGGNIEVARIFSAISSGVGRREGVSLLGHYRQGWEMGEEGGEGEY